MGVTFIAFAQGAPPFSRRAKEKKPRVWCAYGHRNVNKVGGEALIVDVFTLPETNIKSTRKWMAGILSRFLLGPGLFSGANWLLVSERVRVFFGVSCGLGWVVSFPGQGR